MEKSLSLVCQFFTVTTASNGALLCLIGKVRKMALGTKKTPALRFKALTVLVMRRMSYAGTKLILTTPSLTPLTSSCLKSRKSFTLQSGMCMRISNMNQKHRVEGLVEALGKQV
jgi:hypothetical protein